MFSMMYLWHSCPSRPATCPKKRGVLFSRSLAYIHHRTWLIKTQNICSQTYLILQHKIIPSPEYNFSEIKFFPGVIISCFNVFNSWEKNKERSNQLQSWRTEINMKFGKVICPNLHRNFTCSGKATRFWIIFHLHILKWSLPYFG